MNRWFVYVDENQRIVIHPEVHPCSHIFVHVRGKAPAYEGKFKIESVKNAVKIVNEKGYKNNKYWLIIWAKSVEEAKKDSTLGEISKKLGLRIRLCRKCKNKNFVR